MPLQTVRLDQLTPQDWAAFSACIDVRTPSEWAHDHLPGALNWPVLSDEERVRVGTLYKQVSPFEAQKVGAACVARRIAEHLDAHTPGLSKSWKPLVYCWRGGKRSGSMAHVLSQVGFHVTWLEGGYKAFRRHVVQALDTLPPRLSFQVLAGPTGSGKSRLLQALAAHGEQVLDLEALACHKGSLLGQVQGQPQPTQKAFETALWQVLQGLDPLRPVFVESESARVGTLRVPLTLLACIRRSPCWAVQVDLADRVAFLKRDYPHFVAQPQELMARLKYLSPLLGQAQIDAWGDALQAGRIDTVVQELLTRHYDPVYSRSLARNFASTPQGAPAPAQTPRGVHWRATDADTDRAVTQLLAALHAAGA